jgi:hypothetical protein
MLPTPRRKRWTRKGEGSDMWACFFNETICIPGQVIPDRIRIFPVSQTGLGFNLDRDYKVHGTNDRD